MEDEDRKERRRIEPIALDVNFMGRNCIRLNRNRIDLGNKASFRIILY